MRSNRAALILIVFLCAAAATWAAPVNWQIGTPIVTYWAGPDMTDATAQQMADGGFNLVWCGEKQLDTVAKHGLRAMLHDGLLNPASLDNPAKREQLDALIERVKTHPVLYAYFITDEPNSARFPELGKLVGYLREKDPTHLAYINLFPTYATNEQLGNRGDVSTAYREHLRQFIETVKPDLISYDHYHFTADGDGRQYFLNLALIREAALQADLPFLNIVQAATWTPAMRIPHTSEVRWLVNTSLAYGAQGISYYVYYHPTHLGALATSNGTPTPLYYGLKSVNRDFVAMANELRPLKSLGAYHVGGVPEGATALPKGVQTFSIAQADGQKVLLGYFGAKSGKPTSVVVVNLDYTHNAIVRVVAQGKLERFDPAHRVWVPLPDKQPLLPLKAGGAQLLRLAH